MNVDAPAIDIDDDIKQPDPDHGDGGGNEPGDDMKEDEKQEDPQHVPAVEDHEAAAVGKLIYQTPNAPDDEILTAEGDAADIPVDAAAVNIEPGPGHGDDDEKQQRAPQGMAEVDNSMDFRAHKVIPWCRSDVFQAMLNHNYRESNEALVTFNDIRSKTFGGLFPVSL